MSRQRAWGALAAAVLGAGLLVGLGYGVAVRYDLLTIWVTVAVLGCGLILCLSAWTVPRAMARGRKADRELVEQLNQRLFALDEQHPSYLSVGGMALPSLGRAIEELTGEATGDVRGIAWLIRQGVMELWVLERTPRRVATIAGSEIEDFEFRPLNLLQPYTVLTADVRQGAEVIALPMAFYPTGRKGTTPKGREALKALVVGALRDGDVPDSPVDPMLLTAR